MMHNVIIGLGSNIEPEKNIPKAKEFLADQYRILKESRFMTTTPIGKFKQPSFINGAVAIKTELTQVQLEKVLKKIEAQLGRKRSKDKFSSRTIDLDIVVWDSKIVDKDFYKRDYLRQSILEIEPDLKY